MLAASIKVAIFALFAVSAFTSSDTCSEAVDSTWPVVEKSSMDGFTVVVCRYGKIE